MIHHIQCNSWILIQTEYLSVYYLSSLLHKFIIHHKFFTKVPVTNTVNLFIQQIFVPGIVPGFWRYSNE